MRATLVHDHAKELPSFQDMIAELYPDPDCPDCHAVIPITFQVTEACNLACTYCYQIHKTPHSMSLETAKKAIDVLLADNDYISPRPKACTIEFIGGEPLLEIQLMRDIYEYFLMRTHELKHPWFKMHRVSICSNGTLYFEPEFQKLLADYGNAISFAVTVDGTKEMHDACRIFPDGTGSYDKAIAASNHYRSLYHDMSSKVTFSPNNITYVSEAIIHLHQQGYHTVHANCVFEEGWEIEHAKIFYEELKKIALYCDDNDTYSDFYCSLFREDAFDPIDFEQDDRNHCGGTGSMIAVDYKGMFYPCLRYMPSSLGDDREPIIMGDVCNGLCTTEEQKCMKCHLDSITWTSQSTQECIECPINSACAWCSGYNYQVTGDANKRVTYICVMHKARALANIIYWNNFYNKHNVNAYWENYVPKEWALEIISEEEWDYLNNLIEEQKKKIK